MPHLAHEGESSEEDAGREAHEGSGGTEARGIRGVHELVQERGARSVVSEDEDGRVEDRHPLIDGLQGRVGGVLNGGVEEALQQRHVERVQPTVPEDRVYAVKHHETKQVPRPHAHQQEKPHLPTAYEGAGIKIFVFL